MITYVRTAVAAPGKLLELVAFGQEIGGVISRITGRKTAVATSVGGNANEVAWISQADSLGQLEEIFGKLMADSEYRAALKKAEHLVVARPDARSNLAARLSGAPR